MVNQNEVLTVASVTNNGLTVNTVEALQFNHYGGCKGCCFALGDPAVLALSGAVGSLLCAVVC
jgi:hypothetical protein